MNPLRALGILSVVTVALVGVACGSGEAQVAQTAVAQRVDGYPGVNNLFYDGSFYPSLPTYVRHGARKELE